MIMVMMSDSLSIDAVHNAHYGGDKVRYVQVFAYPRSAPQIKYHPTTNQDPDPADRVVV